MIRDLDRTLEVLLTQDLPRDVVEQATISFDTPDDRFPPPSVRLPAIDLFLYDVRENRELRNNQWIVERNGSTVTKQRPPVRVDCSYLVTAWTRSRSNKRTEDEHYLLGEVMKVLLRHTTIPAAILQGDLQGQTPPLPAITLQPGRLQSLGEFWQALGGKPKAALNYTVTIGVQPRKKTDIGPPMTDKRIPA